jgi:hypothetical protein
MTLIRAAIGLPFVKSFVLGQARNASAIAGGYLVTHGLAAGYTAPQIVGALCCLAAIAFQAIDNVVVHGKIAQASVQGAAQ